LSGFIDSIHSGWRKLWIPLNVSLLAYLLMAYGTERGDAWQVLIQYGILFGCFTWIFRKSDGKSIPFLLLAGIMFRLLFLVHTPALSDDYLRYLWDGHLVNAGLNPYNLLPSEAAGTMAKEVPEQMLRLVLSKDYYSVYPPFSQSVFGMAVFIAPGSLAGQILFLRLFILLTEVLSLVLITRLLDHFNQPRKKALLYALNPLVIIELSGNLHMEALMIGFLLMAVWLLVLEKPFPAGLAFALAVSAKLIPLMFLPILLLKPGRKNALLFFSSVLGFTGLLTLPFFNAEMLRHFWQSLRLYFHLFEFNGSLYYVVRWIGFQVKGYNIIHEAGPVFSLITLLAVCMISFVCRKKGWPVIFQAMLWSLALYFLLATTVNPWYITSMVALGLFSNYRFYLVWSLTVTLSYFAYAGGGFHEATWILWFEYLPVYGFLLMDLIKPKPNVPIQRMAASSESLH